MFSELLAKRNGILQSLQQMSEELSEVNNQITEEVAEANRKIAELQKEVTSLGNLKTQNTASIKNLKKILGE